jgi:hypothetical protein
MARIEYIKHRLNNWALWKARESAGGLGFAKQSVLLSEAVDRYREASMPVDDTDGQLTNTAVEALKQPRPHLYEVLQLIYIAGIGINATSRRLGRAESTIKANLEQADQALSVWFLERSQKLKYKSTLTT